MAISRKRKLLTFATTASLVAGVSGFLWVDSAEAAWWKVSVCHKGRVIVVAPTALPAHLLHGDALGRCGAGGDEEEEGY